MGAPQPTDRPATNHQAPEQPATSHPTAEQSSGVDDPTDVLGPGAPPVPVVLVHWNQPESCASSIAKFLASSVPTAVTVVDNGSTTASLATLRELIAGLEGAVGRVELVETGGNLGFGPGANVGISHCLNNGVGWDWVVLAPHDADPAGDCLWRMLEAARAHPMAGLMCADVGDGMVPVIDPYFGGMVVPAGEDRLNGQGWEDVDYPHGTLMMLSRRCVVEIGLFDERYFSYCEEAQLATRAAAAGFEIGLVRGARVTNTHIGSAVAVVDYLQTRNTLLFVREHSGRYHAFIRLCIALLQLADGSIRPTHRPLIFSGGARLRGIRDFLLGRFGPPPRDVEHRGTRATWA